MNLREPRNLILVSGLFSFYPFIPCLVEATALLTCIRKPHHIVPYAQRLFLFGRLAVILICLRNLFVAPIKNHSVVDQHSKSHQCANRGASYFLLLDFRGITTHRIHKCMVSKPVKAAMAASRAIDSILFGLSRNTSHQIATQIVDRAAN